MLKQFYEKALPTQGVYCITSIGTDKKVTNKFAETFDGVFEQIEKFKAKELNTFVALGTFDGFSRKAADCLFVRSFFIDLDVGAEKDYTSKDDAHAGVISLLVQTGLPQPVLVDSGGGIHAYWIMDEDIPRDEWKVYAEKFKALCLEYISIDPVVTADAARIMRAPETLNYKTDPPLPTSVISEEISVYEWAEFKDFLDGGNAPAAMQETQSILESVSKGLDDDTRAMLKLDNFPKTFEILADKSLNGTGCAQIAHILIDAQTIEEPLWWAGLSIAKFCDDGATAIHKMSEDYTGYNYENTEEKASRFPAPRTCEWFLDNYPKRCEGCQHKGKITSPITLGKEFRPAATTDKADPVRQNEDTKTVPDFPEFLYPFMRGINGGI
jgi:hypothetical protein